PHIRRLFDAYGPQRCYWGPDKRLRQGDLQAAHYPLHRGTDVPVRAGQRSDHGTRHSRAPRLDLVGNGGRVWLPLCPESDRIDTPPQLSESLCNRTTVEREAAADAPPVPQLERKRASSARARSYNGFIATLRNLTVPSPNCSANGPSVCRPLRTLAVCLP